MKKALTLPAGILIVALVFGQTQRLVLFEEFVGENCPPCALIAPTMDAVITGANGADFVYIQYLTFIPIPGILNRENSLDPGERLSYYNFQQAPSGVQDGVQWDSTATYGWYDPGTWAYKPSYLTTEYSVPSPFTLSISHGFTESTDSFYATVNLAAVANFSTSGTLNLQVIMVEDLKFQSPPGNNGQTFFPHAVRKMYPDYNGTSLSTSWTTGQNKTVALSGKVPAYIRDKTKVTFVAFIQETLPNRNNHVEQAAISKPDTFDIDLQAANVQGSFANCYNAQYTPVLNVNNIGKQTINSFNILEYVDGVFISSVPWMGNLHAGQSLSPVIPPLSINAGTHNLRLVLSSPNGGADANPGNDSASATINIPAQPVAMPLTEGFENGADSWAIDAPDHDSTWRIVNIGDASAHSFMINYLANLTSHSDFARTVDYLYSPPLNLTYAAHASLRFSRAYQLLNLGGTYGVDSLYIDVSSDCGASWHNVYKKGDINLATADSVEFNGVNVKPFVPAAHEWKRDTADISVVANYPDALLRFATMNYSGNSLYMDNINIDKYDSTSYVGGIEPVSGIQALNIYPNPADNMVNICLRLNESAETAYQITDVAGNVVAAAPAQVKNSGQNLFTVNTGALTDGIYFLSVTSGCYKITRMMAVIH